MTDYATESGHWYHPDGRPCYTVIGTNGIERNTTLRDARKYGLYSSVTTIIREASAPGLERWKRQQVLLAALTLPRVPGEPEDAFLRRVEQDWQAQGKAAADRGTEIHGAIEAYFQMRANKPELDDWVLSAAKTLKAGCGEQGWSAEKSFAHRSGYGGKVDLNSPEWVIDIKTKENALKAEPYDDHFMQLAAYRHGMGHTEAKCGVLFVDRDYPQSVFVPIAEEELVRGLAMFNCLRIYWQTKTGHYPAGANDYDLQGGHRP